MNFLSRTFYVFQKFEAFSIGRMIPPQSIIEKDLLFWRARILFLIVFSGLLIGLVVLIPVSLLAIKEKMWGLLIFDLLVWLSGIGLLTSRHLGYVKRAGIVSCLLYCVGLVVILTFGPLSGGPAWLFTFAILVAVFFGARTAFFALAVNAVTLFSVGWFIQEGVIGKTFPFFNSREMMLAAGANFILLNAMAAISIAALVKGLVSTHQKSMKLTRELKQKHATMMETSAKIESEIEERKQTEELLKNSESRYRFLADHVTDNIWTMDMDLNFTYISPSIYRIRGYRVEEALTHKLEQIMPPDSYQTSIAVMTEELDKHERGEKPPDDPQKVEVELYRKDGSKIWCEVQANFTYDSSGQPNGIIGVTRDITERKQAEEQLIRAEKLATLGDMVAGVAHEISTPLGVGLISASFMSDRVEELNSLFQTHESPPPELHKPIRKLMEASSMVVTNLERAAELLNSFKNVAVDQMIAEKRTFNVRANIEDTVNSLRPKYKRAEHTITINCPKSLEIVSYPGAFSQITTNLIINSLIHGFEDTTHGKISIKIAQKLGVLIYIYQDSGKGMDEHTMHRLYDPFYTTKRNRGGIGLGMHVVHNLITQTLKGQIELNSTPGRGSEFIITIPVRSSAGPWNPNPAGESAAQ